nr:hypothetical protein BaRGS_010015 [Batillaria attramentaria]
MMKKGSFWARGCGSRRDIPVPAWLAPLNVSTWEWDDSYFFSVEQQLMLALVGHYENSVRPVYNASDPVDVSLGLTLTQILDLDEKNQVLTTNVWLEAEWYDERLRWNSSDFDGITSIRIPCEKIWLPDIVLYNSVDDYTSGYMPSLAMVYNDSRVFWGPVIRFRSSCKIDITFFPFDDQICNLKLGSWAYNGFQVNVWNRSTTMDLSNFVDNGEWELLGVKVKRNVVTYNCCDEPFPDVTFYVHLRRRIKYYFMNIIIPCIILSFLCLAGFLLPPESGEKITLGLSVLLTITVFMLMVADKMPQTSESISVISIYLMVVLATSCLSVLSSVLVLGIHHQRGKPRRVPNWLRFLVFGVISRVVCVETYSVYKPSKSAKHRHKVSAKQRERKVPKSPRRGRVATEECEFLKMDYRRKSDVSPSGQTSEPLLESSFSAGGGISFVGDGCTYHGNDRCHHGNDRGHLGNELAPPQPAHLNCMQCTVHNNDTAVIHQLITFIQSKHNEEVKDEEVYREWHDVACVLDRLLFYVFLIITIVSAVTILEMRPSDLEF